MESPEDETIWLRTKRAELCENPLNALEWTLWCWRLCWVLLAPNCFCLLSCLVHRCALSPHRDAGGLRRVIRESWAGSCSSATKTISSVNDKPTFIALPKRTNRRPYRWGAENSALPNMRSGDPCEFYWLFFLWCPTSYYGFLWLLSSALSPLQLAGESPFPRFKSGLQWTPLKVILILRE